MIVYTGLLSGSREIFQGNYPVGSFLPGLTDLEGKPGWGLIFILVMDVGFYSLNYSQIKHDLWLIHNGIKCTKIC